MRSHGPKCQLDRPCFDLLPRFINEFAGADRFHVACPRAFHRACPRAFRSAFHRAFRRGFRRALPRVCRFHKVWRCHRCPMGLCLRMVAMGAGCRRQCCLSRGCNRQGEPVADALPSLLCQAGMLRRCWGLKVSGQCGPTSKPLLQAPH